MPTYHNMVNITHKISEALAVLISCWRMEVCEACVMSKVKLKNTQKILVNGMKKYNKKSILQPLATTQIIFN